MEAKTKILSNGSELDKAESMNLPCEPIYVWTDFVFRINDITMAYLQHQGAEISVFLNGENFVMKNENNIWNKIKENINGRN